MASTTISSSMSTQSNVLKQKSFPTTQTQKKQETNLQSVPYTSNIKKTEMLKAVGAKTTPIIDKPTGSSKKSTQTQVVEQQKQVVEQQKIDSYTKQVNDELARQAGTSGKVSIPTSVLINALNRANTPAYGYDEKGNRVALTKQQRTAIELVPYFEKGEGNYGVADKPKSYYESQGFFAPKIEVVSERSKEQQEKTKTYYTPNKAEEKKQISKTQDNLPIMSIQGGYQGRITKEGKVERVEQTGSNIFVPVTDKTLMERQAEQEYSSSWVGKLINSGIISPIKGINKIGKTDFKSSMKTIAIFTGTKIEQTFGEKRAIEMAERYGLKGKGKQAYLFGSSMAKSVAKSVATPQGAAETAAFIYLGGTVSKGIGKGLGYVAEKTGASRLATKVLGKTTTSFISKNTAPVLWSASQLPSILEPRQGEQKGTYYGSKVIPTAFAIAPFLKFKSTQTKKVEEPNYLKLATKLTKAEKMFGLKVPTVKIDYTPTSYSREAKIITGSKGSSLEAQNPILKQISTGTYKGKGISLVGQYMKETNVITGKSKETLSKISFIKFKEKGKTLNVKEKGLGSVSMGGKVIAEYYPQTQTTLKGNLGYLRIKGVGASKLDTSGKIITALKGKAFAGKSKGVGMVSGFKYLQKTEIIQKEPNIFTFEGQIKGATTKGQPVSARKPIWQTNIKEGFLVEIGGKKFVAQYSTALKKRTLGRAVLFDSGKTATFINKKYFEGGLFRKNPEYTLMHETGHQMDYLTKMKASNYLFKTKSKELKSFLKENYPESSYINRGYGKQEIPKEQFADIFAAYSLRPKGVEASMIQTKGGRRISRILEYGLREQTRPTIQPIDLFYSKKIGTKIDINKPVNLRRTRLDFSKVDEYVSGSFKGELQTIEGINMKLGKYKQGSFISTYKEKPIQQIPTQIIKKEQQPTESQNGLIQKQVLKNNVIEKIQQKQLKELGKIAISKQVTELRQPRLITRERLETTTKIIKVPRMTSLFRSKLFQKQTVINNRLSIPRQTINLRTPIQTRQTQQTIIEETPPIIPRLMFLNRTPSIPTPPTERLTGIPTLSLISGIIPERTPRYNSFGMRYGKYVANLRGIESGTIAKRTTGMFTSFEVRGITKEQQRAFRGVF